MLGYACTNNYVMGFICAIAHIPVWDLQLPNKEAQAPELNNRLTIEGTV